MSGYPPPAGFNPNLGSSYPPQGQVGYPPQGGPIGYPPQTGGPIGYPPQTGGPIGYPPQGGGPMGGYPPQSGGPMGGYPPQGGGPMGGYPPQGGGPMGAPGQPAFGGPGAPPSAYPQPGYGGPPPTGPGAPGHGSFGGAMGPGYGGPQPPQPAAPGYGAPAGYGGTGATGPAYGAPPAASAYYSGRPTVVPAPNFDPGKDADELRKAMRGLGTDEDRIIAVLSKRTAAQRIEIETKYRASFGKDLKKDLKGELSGKFEDVVLASIMDLPTMLATSLYNAMKGAGTKEWVLIQVLVPHSNAIVKATVDAYHKTVGRNLETDIRGDTSGDFEKILVALMQGCREENAPVDMARAQTDADNLYNAGEKRLGTEEAVFTRILTQRSFGQIKAISECYQKKYGRTLEKAIKKETSGYYEKTMVAIVRFAEDKNSLLADWFYDSMVGLGTRDEMLIRLVLGRCEIDLQDVKEAYMRKYNKPLVKAIKGDTSGDYRKMLVALVGP